MAYSTEHLVFEETARAFLIRSSQMPYVRANLRSVVHVLKFAAPFLSHVSIGRFLLSSILFLWLLTALETA